MGTRTNEGSYIVLMNLSKTKAKCRNKNVQQPRKRRVSNYFTSVTIMAVSDIFSLPLIVSSERSLVSDRTETVYDGDWDMTLTTNRRFATWAISVIPNRPWSTLLPSVYDRQSGITHRGKWVTCR